MRYVPDKVSAPDFVYMGPESKNIEHKNSLRDLGVMLSCDLSFSLQIEKAVSSASQMVGWG